MRAPTLSLFLMLMFLYPAGPVSAADDVQERAVPNTPFRKNPIPVAPVQTADEKIAILQQQVQTLQAQVATLQSVLKVTATGATLQAPSLSLLSTEGVTVRSGKGIAVSAGTDIAMQSQAGTSIKASSTIAVDSSGTLTLKGAQTRLNGGTKPLATLGSAVGNGQILTGSPTILGE